jgi:membrane dipeptidase
MMGGDSQIGFVSDLDGINQMIQELEIAGKYEYLIETLCKNYTEEQVHRFMSRNWREFKIYKRM